MVAQCLLALWGRLEFESDDDEIQSYTGALALAEGLHHLAIIAEAHTRKRE